jgi:hypothetical protein
MIYFWAGGLLAKVTPFSMLLFRPLMQTSSRVFSFSVALARGLVTFSAPLGYKGETSAINYTVP